MQREDSEAYLEKKSFFSKVLTIYGRNAVMEAMEEESVVLHKLHLSKSNKDAEVLEKMKALASAKGIEVAYHEKKALSRISKNAKQDQGVALDIVLEHFGDVDSFLQKHTRYRIIALDGIQNPQNLGMIIRSCAAGNIDAILLPSKGTAQISPLVIKSSAGTLFKMPILSTDNLEKTLKKFHKADAMLYSLSSNATIDYKKEVYGDKSIFILGNESEGISPKLQALSDKDIAIAMNRGVESLNVAVTAALLAFLD